MKIKYLYGMALFLIVLGIIAYEIAPIKFFKESFLSNQKLIEFIKTTNFKWNPDRIKALEILQTRGAIPNRELTNYYQSKMNCEFCAISTELEIYWDNTFLDTFLTSQVPQKFALLDLHEKKWFKNSENSELIYNYVKNEFKPESIDLLKDSFYGSWLTNIWLNSISRNEKSFNDLIPFLDVKNEFKIINYNRLVYLSYVPDDFVYPKLKIRVCDVAFLEMLRLMNMLNEAGDENIYQVDSVVEKIVADKSYPKLLDLQDSTYVERGFGMGSSEYEKSNIKTYLKSGGFGKHYSNAYFNSDYLPQYMDVHYDLIIKLVGKNSN